MRLGVGVALPGDVKLPAYDRLAQKCGIVHFGIGAFHRAHQAVYTDDAMNTGDRDWAITGVSMRSGDVAAQINPQDGLYTVTARGAQGSETRLIGAVRRVLVAAQERDAVVAALAAPDTHIVSFTITEKGYQRSDGGGFPVFCDLLGNALALRRDAGLPGLTLLSCDNLAGNGAQLSALMRAYLQTSDAALAEWFARECTCPSTMIDRIVPATTDADRNLAGGIRDEGAVVTEPFSQWVIEDKFAGPRPRWEVGGVQLVADVAPYETAKLRMLNGAHSALAYLGLLRGHDFVHQAIGDPAIRPTIDTLMRNEAAPSIDAAPGQDLAAYADALIARFSNPALAHRLIQIAMDGSQKIPQRWLETLAHHQRAGRQCPSLLDAIAAWLIHVRGDGPPVDDPRAAELAALWRVHGQSGIVDAVFGANGAMAGIWVPTASDRAVITAGIGL